MGKKTAGAGGATAGASEALEKLQTGVFEPREVLAELACTNTALRRAARRLGQLYDEAVAPSGLKATQVGLLAQIVASPAEEGHEGNQPQPGPTLQALAERVVVSISALTHALRPLVRDGLVALSQDARDGRTKRAALTPLGLARLKEALVLWAEANQRVETVLGGSAAGLRALADEVSSEAFLDAYQARGVLGG
jgi:DNA-binding MarR family transcriptional regulator